MIERIVENWLININERSLEIPFCQLLNAEGHQVIHLSRHGPYEEGKDVLSIGPDNHAYAFQLKSGNVTLRVWEKELHQITRLVEVPIVHPAISEDDYPRHRSCLVTNGKIDEEVRIEIDHRNRDWERRGFPRLEVIVGGQLLPRFLEISTNLWPNEIQSTKTLLEFILVDGRDNLDKQKLAEFVRSLLPIFVASPTKNECRRALDSAAVVTSYAISQYMEEENHVAIIEAWIVYIANLVLLIEKHNLPNTYYQNTLDIAETAINFAFENLYDELQERDFLVEANTFVDQPFYRGRVTWLLGLVSAYELWKEYKSIHNSNTTKWAKQFVNEKIKETVLWGEAAIPQFLAIIWYMRRIVSTQKPVQLLVQILGAIVTLNGDNALRGLPNPYRKFEEHVAEINGLSDEQFPEPYKGRSYTLKALIHLYTRRNWRRQMSILWPKVTYINFAEFRVEEAWQFCLWYSDNYGKLEIEYPNLTQSWSELRELASQNDTTLIPDIFEERPYLLLLYVIVYPHRLTSDVAKFLDTIFFPLQT